MTALYPVFDGTRACVDRRVAPELTRGDPRPPERGCMNTTDAWTDEVRRAATESVQIAATRYREVCGLADRTLAYYLRGALAHGLTDDEVADLTQLPVERVHELTDPAVCD